AASNDVFLLGVNSVCNVLLTHQSAGAVAKMIDYWSQSVPIESIVIAYGGTRSEFEQIEHNQKLFVDDARLRTSDHQRQFQSYTRLFQSVARFLDTRGDESQFVYFAEYDHLPLVQDLNERQIERLSAEGADLFGFHVHRLDSTSSPHFLNHVANENFFAYWTSIS